MEEQQLSVEALTKLIEKSGCKYLRLDSVDGPYYVRSREAKIAAELYNNSKRVYAIIGCNSKHGRKFKELKQEYLLAYKNVKFPVDLYHLWDLFEFERDQQDALFREEVMIDDRLGTVTSRFIEYYRYHPDLIDQQRIEILAKLQQSQVTTLRNDLSRLMEEVDTTVDFIEDMISKWVDVDEVIDDQIIDLESIFSTSES